MNVLFHQQSTVVIDAEQSIYSESSSAVIVHKYAQISDVIYFQTLVFVM